MKFFDHIIDRRRGGPSRSQAAQKDMVLPLEAWKDAYAHEQFITSKIHAIVKVVRAENDYSAEPLMDWFVKEQIEEEKNTDGIARQLERVGESKDGLYMLDKASWPPGLPAGSCFDPASTTPRGA